MRIATIFGTRPEIIRLSRVIPLLDSLSEHILIHTGQNHNPLLSDVFFDELQLRSPDVQLGIREESAPDQIAAVIAGCARALSDCKPDRVLILGDTNSALSAFIAARMSIPVFHMEAGNRCYDDRVPEEINRRVIDHCSDVLMPYTDRSKENLVREGIERERIFVTGNPIYEVLQFYAAAIAKSDVMQRLSLQPGKYLLATLHRAENVDSPEVLRELIAALEQVAERFEQPLIVSVHPRTDEKLRRFRIGHSFDGLTLLPPLGFFDFVRLEQSASCVLSDSGTVQEECAIFKVPNVTLREVTERPETIECGSNVLGGVTASSILRATQVALFPATRWSAPPGYEHTSVSRTVAKIVLGHVRPR